jgi:hypothetical protein
VADNDVGRIGNPSDNQRLPRPEPNLIWHVAASDRPSRAGVELYPIHLPGRKSALPNTAALAENRTRNSLPDQPVRAETTRPQPIEEPRQIILEWDRR